ncbi:SDR family NAD(P)-dependent oxidoreductase [Sphingobium sp. EP60837]|uniref:SDR family NAD(P)-dependent oxidoreductase n=1 Tax=Sphingobium sp. EP60837 TaxID=1855519 RepID=UPI0007DDF02E|nr:SDR family NAD(P)-dependent oxidoreductase [Sphingobium sp. EP60837]ANI80200.1 Gluconate 5-dehydrogenase [Sphingobium sp. EP60837]
MTTATVNENGAFGLKGRRALVTGSTGGLGLALAQALSRAGCDVMLSGLEASAKVQPQIDSIRLESDSIVAYRQADLSSIDGVNALVDATAKQLSGVDILVNNAVVRHFGPIADLSPENWEHGLAVNLSAAFYSTRRVLPAMRQNGFGRIFNMVSVYGLRGTPDRVGYVTAKAALIGLTRAVALENLDYDITCHALCPGSVLTPGTEERVEAMVAEGLDRAAAERRFLEGKQPSGRFVSTSSVADLLVFLCGPVAQDMTGSLLPVEGGWLAS